MTIACLTEDEGSLLLNKAIASLLTGDYAQSLRYLQSLAEIAPSKYIRLRGEGKRLRRATRLGPCDH